MVDVTDGVARRRELEDGGSSASAERLAVIQAAAAVGDLLSGADDGVRRRLSVMAVAVAYPRSVNASGTEVALQFVTDVLREARASEVASVYAPALTVLDWLLEARSGMHSGSDDAVQQFLTSSAVTAVLSTIAAAVAREAINNARPVVVSSSSVVVVAVPIVNDVSVSLPVPSSLMNSGWFDRSIDTASASVYLPPLTSPLVLEAVGVTWTALAVGVCSTLTQSTALVLACRCCANRLTVQCVCDRNASWWLAAVAAEMCRPSCGCGAIAPFPSDSVLEFSCISTTCSVVCLLLSCTCHVISRRGAHSSLLETHLWHLLHRRCVLL
jgi:hypothetical protein